MPSESSRVARLPVQAYRNTAAVCKTQAEKTTIQVKWKDIKEDILGIYIAIAFRR